MFKADPLMLVQESLARVNEIRKEFLICIELRIVNGSNGKLADRESVNQIIEGENAELIAEVTYDEVKDAVFSMHPEKSPGQDGLNPAFFRRIGA
ncbi:hypothetical protein AgCh_020369 [Apium graveolens]